MVIVIVNKTRGLELEWSGWGGGFSSSPNSVDPRVGSVGWGRAWDRFDVFGWMYYDVGVYL